MKGRSYLAIVIGIIVLSLAVRTPARAINVISGFISVGCSSFTTHLKYAVDRDNTGTGLEHYGYVVTDGAGNILVEQLYTDNFNGTDNFTESFTRPSSADPVTLTFLSFAGNSLPQVVYETATATGCSPAVTWFNPHDGRVDPRPGDHLAIWCDAPDVMVIWGIGPNSIGRPLVKWTKEAIAAAGPKGLSSTLGASGVISVEVTGGQYYVAWNGNINWGDAKFFASGHGDFTKSFACDYTNTGSLGAAH